MSLLLLSCGHTAISTQSQEPWEPFILIGTQNILYTYDVFFITEETVDSTKTVTHLYEVQEDPIVYVILKDLDFQVISKVFRFAPESLEPVSIFFFETPDGLWSFAIDELYRESTPFIVPIHVVTRDLEVDAQWMSTRY